MLSDFVINGDEFHCIEVRLSKHRGPVENLGPACVLFFPIQTVVSCMEFLSDACPILNAALGRL